MCAEEGGVRKRDAKYRKRLCCSCDLWAGPKCVEKEGGGVHCCSLYARRFHFVALLCDKELGLKEYQRIRRVCRITRGVCYSWALSWLSVATHAACFQRVHKTHYCRYVQRDINIDLSVLVLLSQHNVHYLHQPAPWNVDRSLKAASERQTQVQASSNAVLHLYKSACSFTRHTSPP